MTTVRAAFPRLVLGLLIAFPLPGPLAARAQPAGEADAHYRSAVALKEQGKTDEAIHELELAVVERPTHFMAWNSLGILYKKRGDLDKAIDAFEHAVKIVPTEPNAASNLGMAYYRAGRDDDALRALETAARLSPKDADIQANIGTILKKKGDTTGAGFS